MSSNNDLPETQEEAQRLGEKRYFNGLPCIHGHIAPRYTSNYRCTVCSRTLRKPVEKVKKINWGTVKITVVEYSDKDFEAPYFEGVRWAWKLTYPSGVFCTGASSQSHESLMETLNKSAQRYKEIGMSTTSVGTTFTVGKKKKVVFEDDDLFDQDSEEPLPPEY